MSVAKAIKSAARWAALGLSLVTFNPLANAQQPTPAALASAKELISITGATALVQSAHCRGGRAGKDSISAAKPSLGQRPQRHRQRDAHRSTAAFR